MRTLIVDGEALRLRIVSRKVDGAVSSAVIGGCGGVKVLFNPTMATRMQGRRKRGLYAMARVTMKGLLGCQKEVKHGFITKGNDWSLEEHGQVFLCIMDI